MLIFRSAAPLETTQKEASKRRRTIASTCDITSMSESGRSLSTPSTPQTLTKVKPKAGKGSPMFQCEVCRAGVSKDDFIEHVVQVHPSLDPIGCRVLRLVASIGSNFSSLLYRFITVLGIRIR